METKETLNQKSLKLVMDNLALGPESPYVGGRCLEWQGAKTKYGYGLRRFRFDHRPENKPTTAHSAIWQVLNGPVPEGHQVEHKCHNPSCCNPDHLDVATPKENLRRSKKDGRGGYGSEPRNTPNAKLTFQDAEDIRKVYAIKDPKMKNSDFYRYVSNVYGICYSTAYLIVQNRIFVAV